MKKYAVFGTVKKGGHSEWRVDVDAANAKEARNIARDMWESDHSEHLFRIEALEKLGGDGFYGTEWTKVGYSENGKWVRLPGAG